MRQKVIPGARMVMIVTRKLSAHGLMDGQRGVARPAGRECAAGDEEARQHHDPGDRQQPERQRVEAWERHVGCAEHERHDEVCEPGERRNHEQEDHQRRMHGEEAVVRLVVEELHARLGQLGAHEHREEAAREEEENRRRQVLHPDHLVVGVDAEVVAPAVRAVP